MVAVTVYGKVTMKKTAQKFTPEQNAYLSRYLCLVFLFGAVLAFALSFLPLLERTYVWKGMAGLFIVFAVVFKLIGRYE
jgi:hypothetical protein